MRLAAIRLHSSINPHLDDQGLTTPVAIGAATSLPPSVAVRLLTRRQWREGDAALRGCRPAGAGRPLPRCAAGVRRGAARSLCCWTTPSRGSPAVAGMASQVMPSAAPAAKAVILLIGPFPRSTWAMTPRPIFGSVTYRRSPTDAAQSAPWLTLASSQIDGAILG
ncbi:MAG: hypothetical protein ACJ8H8_31365, partial [Geminicoccaceae bacterium]